VAQQTVETLASLHETDETAWLERTAELLRAGRLSEEDTQTLAEYLTDMAQRDRREVFSRLVVLLAHLLKWQFQADQRSRSRLLTILEQQRELRQLLGSKTLRLHAAAIMAEAYDQARKEAAAETGLSRTTFPEQCPWNLEAALTDMEQA
jgi:hypothetical protein